VESARRERPELVGPLGLIVKPQPMRELKALIDGRASDRS
jgi:hypothetical protein